MDDRRFIKPKDGMTVHELTSPPRALPAHGKGVAWSSYWQRRLDDGDVMITTEKAVHDGERAAEKAAAPKGDAA